MADRLNLHIYPSPLTHESRILRLTDALAQSNVFDRFEVIGVAAEGLPAEQEVDARRRFVRVPRKAFAARNSLVAKTVKTAEWSLRVLARLRKRKVACINAHSLAVLPLCYVASRITGAALVYDTHELETETSGFKGLRQKLGRWVERLLIKRCHTVFAVSDSIADWYVQRYGIARPTVVRNIPQFRAPADEARDGRWLRERLGIPTDATLFIYQGGFIAGRGLERLLRVFRQANPDRHLVCMGSGPLTGLVAQSAAEAANIHLLPPVSPQEVLGYTCAADVGICLTDDSCLSHYYSLPNKIFEYLHAGLPIIVNPLIEQQRIVEQYRCGWVAPAEDEALLTLLNGIDRASLAACDPRPAAEAFNWPAEAQRLVERYRSDGLDH